MPQMKWTSSTKFRGVRWYEHPTRKHGARRDRCFGIRYGVAKQRYEAVLGWASEGWTESKAYIQRQSYVQNVKQGKGPTTPKELKNLSQKALAQRKARSLSFEDYFHKRYLPEASQRKNGKTIRVEQQHVRDWISPILQGKPMIEVDRSDLDLIKLSIQDAGRTPRTAQHVLATFRLVWNHASKRDVVSGESPSRGVSVGRINNARTRFLTATEAEDLLQKVGALDPSAFELTCAALYTGARLGELCALKWKDIDLPERQINLTHTKTGEARSIPIAPKLLAVLQTKQAGAPSDLVFVNRQGKPWKEAPWAFRRALKDSGLNEGRENARERICFHSLRHTAASFMLAEGIDVRTIQTLFGWSSLQMLQRYTHTMDHSKRQAMDSLDRALQAPTGKVIPFRQSQTS